MNFADFKKLPYETKCELIGTQYSFITARRYEDFNIFLYYAGKFFVEVFYSPMQARVVMLNGFELMDNTKLEFYVEKITLPKL